MDNDADGRDEKKSRKVPTHDTLFMEAVLDRRLSGEILEAWRKRESEINRPLPDSVMALRALVPSGVKLSDEDLAAFRISRDYQGAMIYTDSGIVRPEDTGGLSRKELRTHAYSLAIGELDFYSRTKLFPRHRWVTALVAAWIMGGATAEAAFGVMFNEQPFWPFVNGKLLLMLPILILLWWAISWFFCREHIKGKKSRVGHLTSLIGRGENELL